MTVLAEVVAVMAAACGGDASSPDGDHETPDDDTLRAHVATWSKQIRKECTVTDAFGLGGAAQSLAFDPVQLYAQLGGNLAIHGPGGDLVVLSAPRPVRFVDEVTTARDVSAASSNGSPREVHLKATRSESGNCVVTYNGETLFERTLWNKIGVAYHFDADAPVTWTQDPGQLFAAGATGAAYLEHAVTDAIPSAFAADLTGVATELSPSFGIPAAELAPFLASQLEAAFEYVEADAATAPFSLQAPSVIPIDAKLASSWLPAAGTTVTRTLHVQIPRTTWDDTRPAEPAFDDVTIHVAIRPVASGGFEARVTDVGAPQRVAGGAAAAVACFQRVSAAALAYAASPALQGSAPRYPGAFGVGDMPAVDPTWLLGPCRGLTSEDGDLPGRGLEDTIGPDPTTLPRVVALLRASSYAGAPVRAGLSPRGWQDVLAALSNGTPRLDLLAAAAAGDQGPLGLGITAARTLLADKRYSTYEQLVRTWNATLLCGAVPTAAQFDRLLAGFFMRDTCTWR